MNEVLVLFLSVLVVTGLLVGLRCATKAPVRVIPMASTALGSGVYRKSPEACELGSTPCILVVNEGDQPVELSGVRYVTRFESGEMHPVARDGKPLPRILEPNQGVTFYFSEHELEGVPRYAVAELANGKTVRGTSPALKQLKDRMEHRRLSRLSTRRVKVA